MKAYSLPPALTADEKSLFLSLRKLLQKETLEDKFLELLARRGIKNAQEFREITEFDANILYKQHENLPGLNKVAEILRTALAAPKAYKVIVHGDYDVDGVCSTSLLWRFLYRDLKLDAVPFVPSRQKDGYGLNLKNIEKLIADNADKEIILWAVDCGIRDEALIKELKDKYPQLQVIIGDHHQLPTKGIVEYEKLAVIVHPMHPDSKVSPKEICATAVVWLSIQGLKELLKIELHDDYLELVAIATICDVMPLRGFNRWVVKQGLTALMQTKVEGLKSLLQVSGLGSKPIGTYEVGFVLGPRLNAAGRIDHAITAVKLLCTDSPTTGYELAVKLNELNISRQDITLEAVTAVTSALDEKHKDVEIFRSEHFMVAKFNTLPEGIVGLISGKLLEWQSLANIVFTKNEAGNFVGSARSHNKFDITASLNEHSTLLIKYGGHAQAAGLTVSEEQFANFTEKILAYADNNLAEVDYQTQTIFAHLAVTLNELSPSLLAQLDNLAPFGQENERVMLALTYNGGIGAQKLGKEGVHLKLLLKEAASSPFEFLAFNYGKRGLDLKFLEEDSAKVIFGTLGYNEFRGVIKPQFYVDAVTPA